MDEQTFDRLKFIAETHRQALDTRRTYEWKTLTMTVSFFVLVAATTYAGKFLIPDLRWAVPITWIATVSVCILSTSYLYLIHKANGDNKSIAEAAEDEIIDALAIPMIQAARNAAKAQRNPKPPFSWLKPMRKHWSFIWQAVTILAFAITSTHLVLVAPQTSPLTCSKSG